MAKRIYKCSRCKQTGHNRTSCGRKFSVSSDTNTQFKDKGRFKKIFNRLFRNKNQTKSQTVDKKDAVYIPQNTSPFILAHASVFNEPMHSTDDVIRRLYSPSREPYPMRLPSKIWRKIEGITSLHGLNLTEKQKKIAEGFPAAMEILENSSKNIQSNAIIEAVYSQEFAERLGLSVFISQKRSPADWRKIISILAEYNFKGIPRYAYCDPDFQQILIVSGSPTDTDAILVLPIADGAKTYVAERIEFKSPVARTGEVDLPPYDDDGQFPQESINKWENEKDRQYRKSYSNMVQEYQKRGQSIFELAGSNAHDFSPTSVREAVGGSKKATLVVTEDKSGKIIAMRQKDVPLFSTLSGEIRTAGKNHAKVWSKRPLINLIKKFGGNYNNGIVTLPRIALKTVVKKGGISRYKIGSLFYFHPKDAIVDNEYVSVNMDKIEQLKPTVAAKVDFSKVEESTVRNYYMNVSNN